MTKVGRVAMEEQWLIDRTRLRQLMAEHPDWTKRQLAEEVGRSSSWVKKWRRRFGEADPDDDSVLYGLSRARHNPPPSITQEVVERILEIRDHPPENLSRTPGPKTILYYLHRDEQLKASGLYLPRSTSTIWSILDRHDRIWRPTPVEHTPVERPEPMTSWQLDFKDISTVPPNPDGKQQHVVEVLNIVDVGTSILVGALPHDEYNAETTLWVMLEVFLLNGLPDVITFDRVPRFVASWTSQDFPTAFVRFLLCLGIEVNILPPRRPDLNGFVERYQRTYEYECLRRHRPDNLEAVHQITEPFKWHYNTERPNQAITCGNRPPYQAFPQLPVRPGLPQRIDSDRWLQAYHSERFKRRVRSNGTVTIDKHNYYIKRALKGRYVVLRVDAYQRQFEAELDHQTIKTIPIKSLYNQDLDFADYVELIRKEAISERRLAERHRTSPRGRGTM
jgi:transposase InsO family protein